MVVCRYLLLSLQQVLYRQGFHSQLTTTHKQTQESISHKWKSLLTPSGFNSPPVLHLGCVYYNLTPLFGLVSLQQRMCLTSLNSDAYVAQVQKE